MATFIKYESEITGKVTWQAKIRRHGIKSQTKTFRRRIDAEKWAASVEGDMARGRFVEETAAQTMTLSEALDDYKIKVSKKKKGHKQECSRIAIWKDSDLASLGLGYIKSDAVAEWRDKRLAEGAAANTVKNDLILLSHVFTIARREWNMPGLVNPVSQIEKPKSPKGRTMRLSRKEEQKLLKVASESHHEWLVPMITLALETGMRLSEILSIKRSLTDLTRRTTELEDTKNDDRRAVPLSLRAVATLQGIPKVRNQDEFFDLKISTFEKHFRLTREKAGLPGLHFHDLRHEATSRLFEHGLGVMEVSAITGHRSLQMLSRYTHLKAENLAKRLPTY